MNWTVATYSAANDVQQGQVMASKSAFENGWNESPAEWAAVQADVARYTGGASGSQTIPVISAGTPCPSTANTTSAPISASGYINPLPQVNVWQRTDQGVDADLPIGAPILAPSAVKIVGIIPDWFEGQPFVWWQLLSGSDAGQYEYVAEEITGVATPGTVLQPGQPIARYAAAGTGIEYGWATKSGATLAHATTGYADGQITPAGSNMRAWLNSLGAHAGPDTSASCTNPCS